MRKSFAPGALALGILVSRSAPAPAQGTSAEVASWLTGTFDTKDQATRDPGVPETRLVAVVVPKSRLGLGAPVLYVEQAASSSLDKPYRQRFYRVEESGAGKILVRVFEPREASIVSGKWRDPADLALYGAADVSERAGCLVTLRKKDDRYEGGTEGNGCPSFLSGARYATSRWILLADRLESDEKGYDPQGTQVWGGKSGPFVFLKRSMQAPTEPLPTRPPKPKIPEPGPIPIVPPKPEPAEPAPSAPPSAPPSVPAQLLAPSLVLFGVEGERRFTAADLRLLPQTVAKVAGDPEKKKPAEWKGVTLLAVLEHAGLKTGGLTARRLLAPAVLVATGADGYAAVFSIEELFDANPPLLVFERDGKPLDAPEGPFRLVCARSPVRSVHALTSLELKLLATNRAEE